MVLTEEEVKGRIESPLNLLNRLKALTSNSRTKSESPCIPPSSESLIDDLEDKIRNGTAKSKATSIMISAMDELSRRLPEVQKAEKLASIASDMNKILNADGRKESNNNLNAQIVIYAPQVVHESKFDVIDVSAIE